MWPIWWVKTKLIELRQRRIMYLYRKLCIVSAGFACRLTTAAVTISLCCYDNQRALKVILNHLTVVFGINFARENSRHFPSSPLVSPGNDVGETSLLMMRHYPDLGSTTDWLEHGTTNQKQGPDLGSDTSSE